MCPDGERHMINEAHRERRAVEAEVQAAMTDGGMAGGAHAEASPLPWGLEVSSWGFWNAGAAQAGVPATAPHPTSMFGGFERHTRGIGGKLLKQMGYRGGHGLGRNGQGIVNPIQPRKLKKRAGLGVHG